MLSNVELYVLILNRVYNVTSLVLSYIVITVFLGLVSGLLLVHSGALSLQRHASLRDKQ